VTHANPLTQCERGAWEVEDLVRPIKLSCAALGVLGMIMNVVAASLFDKRARFLQSTGFLSINSSLIQPSRITNLKWCRKRGIKVVLDLIEPYPGAVSMIGLFRRSRIAED